MEKAKWIRLQRGVGIGERAAGLTALPAEMVAPPRVAECPLHLEALVRDMRPLRDAWRKQRGACR